MNFTLEGQMVAFVTSMLQVKENSNKKQVNSKLKSYFLALT